VQSNHDDTPAIVDFSSRRTESFGYARYRAYSSGTLISEVNGAELTSKFSNADLLKLITQLKELGFFKLSQRDISNQIAAVTRNSGRSLISVDYRIDTLTVRHQGRENTMSWRGIDPVVIAYPEIEDLRKLQKCFEIARGTLVGTLRPP